MMAASRMISGRVPTMVTTFMLPARSDDVRDPLALVRAHPPAARQAELARVEIRDAGKIPARVAEQRIGVVAFVNLSGGDAMLRQLPDQISPPLREQTVGPVGAVIVRRSPNQGDARHAA